MSKLSLATARLKKQQAFTLLEVMLAMAVFAIAGVALLGAAGNNLKNMANLETKMFAQWVASNQLVEVNLNTSWPPRNNKKGKVEMAGREWFWQQKVIKTTDKDMRAVVLEVRLDEDEKQPLTSLMTYVSKVAQ
jgi:general secretion pathway protein I